MRYIKPHRKLLRIWQLRAALSALAPAVLVSLFFTPFSPLWQALTAAWVMGYAFFIAAYLPMRYLSTSYRIDERTVEINHGVFYLTSKIVLLRNVEFVTLESMPDERMAGLSAIGLFVVGGRARLSGLTADDARSLMDYLPGTHRMELQMPTPAEPDPPAEHDGLLPTPPGDGEGEEVAP